MAELCLACLNKLMGTKHSRWKYVLSSELDFCEECCQWKPVVVMERKAYYWNKLLLFLSLRK